MRALLAVLCGRFRISRREVVELCRDVFDLRVSLGSVDNVCRRVGAALSGPVAEIERLVKAAPVAHLDESGWRERGVRRWMWVAVTACVTLFRIAPNRSGDVARGLLGEDFAGHLVTDRWSGYSRFPVERRQVCWSHLDRDRMALG